MNLAHVRFHVTVELLADAHIGTGHAIPLSTLRPHLAPVPGGGDPEVAVVARDHAGHVTIPPTALKGSLRSALRESTPAATLDELFGCISAEGETHDAATMGRFGLYPAVRLGASLPAGELPGWREEDGTFIATHVALSRDSGTAKRHHLFAREMVPAGTRFRVEGVCFAGMARARADLALMLAPLRAAGGVPIGAGTRLGLGALALVGREATLAETRFDAASGEVVTDPEARLTIAPLATHDASVKLRLTCKGPFASVDPRRYGQSNRIAVLRRNDDVPVLQPASLAGALRSRAAWLAALEGMGGDDRFGILRDGEGAAALTSVERLFGVTGWRGLLRLSGLAVSAEGRMRTITQISLDRFTGAVLDGTLFEHEVFTGVTVDVALRLDRRTDVDGVAYPCESDRQLYEKLLDDLVSDGLRLGHATNRGFGWFEAALAEDRAR